MRRVTCALLGLVLGIAGLSLEPPDPQDILAASQAIYRELATFTATLNFAIPTQEEPERAEVKIKVLCAYPLVRSEFTWPEDMAPEEFLSLPVVEITDYGTGRTWTLFSDGKWEEVLDPSLVKELEFPFDTLDILVFGILTKFQPETARVESREGRDFWMITGKTSPGPFSGDVEVWIEKETLAIWRVEWKIFESVFSLTIEEFHPKPELLPELFPPPLSELIARKFTLVPEAREILGKVWDKLSAHETFVVQRREPGEFTEEIITYRHPYLRVEEKEIQIGQFPGDLLRLTIYDFSEGFVYHYDPHQDTWEKWRGQKAPTPEESLYFALTEAFGLVLPEVVQPVSFSETVIRGRKAWYIVSRGFPGTDAPGPEWWIDQETLQILRYAEPMQVNEIWTARYVEIQSVELDAEVPEELFSVPEDVPERQFGITKPAAPLEGWEPFTWKAFEEAESQGKSIVLYFSAEWCPPCWALEAGPLRDPKVQELLAPFARFKVDLTHFAGEAKEVADRYRVREFPTLLFLDPAGNEIGRIRGYSPATFLKQLKEILGQ